MNTMNNRTIGYALLGTGLLNLVSTLSEAGTVLLLTSLALLVYGGYTVYRADPRVGEFLQSRNLSAAAGKVNLSAAGFSPAGGKLPVLPLVCSGLMFFSVFLPWMSVKVSGGMGGRSMSQTSPSLSGFEYDDSGLMVLVVLLGAAAAFMAYRKMKYAVVCGLVGALLALGYMVGLFGKGAGTTGSRGGFGVSVETSLVPQFGLYLLLLASLGYAFTTFRFYRRGHVLEATSPAA